MRKKLLYQVLIVASAALLMAGCQRYYVKEGAETEYEAGSSEDGTYEGNTSSVGKEDVTEPSGGDDVTGETTTNKKETTEAPTTTKKPEVTTKQPETTTKQPETTDSSDDKDKFAPLVNYPVPVTDVGITTSDTAATAVSKIVKANVKDSMSTAEKIKILHDYLVYTVDYDVAGMNRFIQNGGKDYSVFDEDVFTPEGALIDKVAVCEGYAEAFRLLLDEIGVKNIIVYGQAGGNNHAWNMVNLAGCWYHVDVTHGDPTRAVSSNEIIAIPNGENISYNNFLVPESIIKMSHTIDKKDTVSRNANISSYPSNVDDSRYLEMVYPWVEISGISEFDKVHEYFEHDIFKVRIIVPTTVDISEGSAFWTKVSESVSAIITKKVKEEKKSYSGSYSATYSTEASGQYIILLNVVIKQS